MGGANTANVHVELETDVDAHCQRARQAGAAIEMEPADQLYGARTYRAKDPKGHVWTTEVHVRFEPVDDETQVVVEHTGWDAIAPRRAARHGFPLEAFLEREAEWWQALLRSLQSQIQPGRAKS